MSTLEGPLDGIRVLFVDDNDDAREILKALLEFDGAAVTLASDAAEALQRLRDARPDVIITDITMPRVDGRALLGRLRDTAASVNIPVIAMTGLQGPTQERELLAAGFDAYLCKPMRSEATVAAIHRVLRSSRERRSA
jgi:two-component system CheB/CheR fusion protein